MHLKSITVKGFKSFPDRTRLEFGPGVSVIVGPNGSGKSNITDAVLWAMGEQSPLAVRGQSMQDVIFAGARGQQARPAAEVEVVLDNSDGALDSEFSEISIFRRLDRSGDGEYRLNGARCRLVDVLEVLSDTGLGKEMHSVVSQGRVEAVVTSKPRDRRLLIEEAAGLGKHRKRRRRAQLKLDRTQDNLDRALDVEREARSRLRPLKRQAEAAELHERLERQSVEARWTLGRDAVRTARAELAAAEARAAAARTERDAVDAALAEVAARREACEQALAERGERRDELARRAYAARSAVERIGLRLEQARTTAEGIDARAAALEAEIATLSAAAAADTGDPAAAGRVAALEAELETLSLDRAERLARDLEALEAARAAAAAVVAERDAAVAGAAAGLAEADAAADAARSARREADAAAERARRDAAAAGAELAAVNQFLRLRAGAPGGARSLADDLKVEPGYELALAAVLGGRLRAGIARDLATGGALLDAAGADGGSALVPPRGAVPAADPGPPPAPGAEPLAGRVRGGDAGAVALARALLAGTWVVDDLQSLPDGFAGTAVTAEGRVWFGARRELRQAPQGGEDRVLEQRNRRDTLIAAAEAAAAAEQAALAAVQAAGEQAAAADAAREAAADAARAARRVRDDAADEERRAADAVARRRDAPDSGAGAARRSEIESALAAERRLAEQAEAARTARAARLEAATARHAAAEALRPAAARLAAALEQAGGALEVAATALQADLDADHAEGERLAAALRAGAQEEAGLQARLRARAEAVTAAEVAAQQVRDHAAEAEAELVALANRLGLEAQPAEAALPAEEADALRQRIERLARRREQLGPVNPLAQEEYAEALAHVEELETQRHDLEAALRELRSLIAETDRRIRESFEATFTAASRNFEAVVSELFPGGRGRLRLVREERGPAPVLGGADAGVAAEQDGGEAPEAGSPDGPGGEEGPLEEEYGVEIEMTPAGKSMKRLSLLSGGEKSMTALAFLFAIFLARPCPFYVLDEVEAALDDLNIDRFLTLLRAHAADAQFIVVTHQKRTMEAADTLYGVSMGNDGISKVISRRLPAEEPPVAAAG